jgi:hypothetical protein
MRFHVFSLAATIITALAAFAQGPVPHAEIDWLDKVYSDGSHNAFTDLIQWKDHYYLCFRHGESHGSLDGEIRVMRSADTRTWEPCGTLDTAGDDRDPHFTATDDALYVYFGTWDLRHMDGNAPPDRQSVRSYFASTNDGVTWSKIQGIYEPDWWVWRVRYLDGRFYGIAYTAYRPKPAERVMQLVVSDDGLNWTLASKIADRRQPSESDLTMLEDGSLFVVTRMQDDINEGFIWRSNPDHSEWTGETVGDIVHSPALAKWMDRFFVAGRSRDSEQQSVTRVWELIDGKAVELITLPSGGDTSYPGLIVDPNTVDAERPALLVSWYSQHDENRKENKHAASIYTARLNILE